MGLKVPENMDELQGSCQSANPEKSIGISKERQSKQNPPEIKDPTKCRLACVHDGKTFNVAIGTVYPLEDSNLVIHGTPLLIGNARVSIDKILEGTAPLPFPTQYHERVGDAIGSFVQWPKELIIVGEESSTSGNLSVASKGKQVSKSSGIKSPIKPNSNEYISRMGIECQKLHDYLALMRPETKVFEVVLPSKIFHFKEDKSLTVTEEDIMQLFRMAFLNVSSIQVWMLFLQKLCEEQNHEGMSGVGFLCPTIMSQMGKDKIVNDEVMNYVECSLLKMRGVRIIFAPFCQGDHWFLAVICPLIHEAYFCDPKATSKRDVSFKHLIQIAFRSFRAQAGSTLKSGLSMKWSNIDCHQQTRSTECGYYVMRYMLDIWFGSKASYTIEEINEVRDLWATHFMDNLL
ncbi:uncharacterized protein LOC141629565 [Silene latifolia]|uniref:uncharacterized protein LOC141629565 n=1 Tax=Silene latifolia TaxID=37657 RepID=UPI003D76DE9F